MAQDNPTPGSLLFLYNLRRHYVLPSKHNDFGGYRVERIILDSGCSSLLLPLPTANDLNTLMLLFPTTQHCWQIRTASNPGPIKTRTLEITLLDGGNFPVSLCENVSLYQTTTAALRFVLCLQDAQDLLASPLNILGRPLLTSFVNEIALLQQHLPNNAQIAPRRNYALFGQSMLRNMYQIQSSVLAFVHPSLDRLLVTQAAITAHYNAAISWVPLDFDVNNGEFDFIDDLEHHEETGESDEYLTHIEH